jgi:hypothetical protein
VCREKIDPEGYELLSELCYLFRRIDFGLNCPAISNLNLPKRMRASLEFEDDLDEGISAILEELLRANRDHIDTLKMKFDYGPKHHPTLLGCGLEETRWLKELLEAVEGSKVTEPDLNIQWAVPLTCRSDYSRH